MTTLYWILAAVVLIGAFNWGLIGFFNYDLVGAIFGSNKHPATRNSARVVYALVGLCALGLLIILAV